MREFWILANDGTKKYPLDTTQWHTYRLTTENSTVNLYVDGNEVPVLTGQLRDRTDGVNSIEFGDRSGSGDGRFDLDYIRVYLDGAVTPSAANPYEFVDSIPADGESLPRTANNEIRLVFSRGIDETLPWPPLSIIRIGTSVDDANDFTYSLATTTETNDTLVATENGSILGDLTWYRVKPTGIWAKAFSIEMPTFPGDVDGNGQGIVMNNGWTGVDENGAHMSSIIWHENQWKMWYTGIRNMGQPACQNYGFQIIAYATSSNGYHWTKHGVVFDVDPNHAAFDAYSVRSPAVIHDADTDVLRLYYNGSEPYGDSEINRIGGAWSWFLPQE